jgi:hypothetical protein
MTLDVGTSYTLTVSLKESSTGPWAGSNIYWDGRRLTFDPMGRTDHTLYSGVIFQWGSLVGVSASEFWDASGPATSTATLYIPTYDSGNELASTWHSGPAGAEIGIWTDIPAMTPPNSDLPTTAYLYNNSNPTSYAGMTGDICRYIGDTGAGPKGYRMPKGSEFNLDGHARGTTYYWPDWETNLSKYTGNYWEKVGDFPALFTTYHAWLEGNADGTTSMSSYFILNWSPGIRVFFPCGNMRETARSFSGAAGAGTLDGVGRGGEYWSGSPGGSDSSIRLYLGISALALYAIMYNDYGYAIRCIKNI